MLGKNTKTCIFSREIQSLKQHKKEEEIEIWFIPSVAIELSRAVWIWCTLKTNENHLEIFESSPISVDLTNLWRTVVIFLPFIHSLRFDGHTICRFK